MKTSRLRRAAGMLTSLLVGSVAAWTALRACRAVLEHEASPLFDGDPDAERALARGAASWGATAHVDYDTGSELFDREWAFGAPAMRAACLAQVILRDPSADAELGPALDRATEEILSPKSRAFSAMKWGSDPLDDDRIEHAHAAYYGYAGLAVGLASWAHPTWAPARRDLANRLRARVRAAGEGWPETYPGEAYPPDVAMGVGALGLDEGESAPSDERLVLERRLDAAIDPTSGLLVQSVDAERGVPRDGARGSGTFLASYALLYGDVEQARALHGAGRALRATRLGFLGMREHLEAATADIDSGPVLLDLGVSATGFALAGARAFRDEETFVGLDATARLFSVPLERDDGGVVSLAGGPLGDAILCAMRTAPTPDEVAAWRTRSGASSKGAT